MKTKPISCKAHAVIDYVLVSSLLLLPPLLRLNKRARCIYAIEAIGLLTYVAITKTPLAVKPMIPFRTHGRIDPLNVAVFALQTIGAPFRKKRTTLLFNIIFTAMAAATVLLTDWKRGEGKQKY